MSILRLLSLVGTCSLAVAGCDLNKLAADQTAEIAEAGERNVAGFWDYDIAGKAMPAAILQAEALVSVSPENDKLRLGLAKTYVSYAFGWVQDQWELADERGDFETADQLEHRVMYMYLRATAHAMHVVHKHDGPGKLREKLATGNAQLTMAYLRENFTEQKDVASLYWAGIGWGSAIANSRGDMKMFADAAVARQLLERSVELDPRFADSGGLGVLGTVEAVFPQLFGGSLEKSKALFERALTLCERKNHLVLLGYAKNYAVAKQDRELFVSLLTEILEAPDVGWELRLSNKVARHRAQRYIQQVDRWFDPALASNER